MFKRIARKRKRLEEEEALGIDEEMREALGINAVNTDSDESESDSDQNDPDEDESEVSEQASADESDILDEEDEEDGEGQSQAEEEVSEVGDMVDADEPPAISKRALKKQARQQQIQKLRERKQRWKRKVASTKSEAATISSPTDEHPIVQISAKSHPGIAAVSSLRSPASSQSRTSKSSKPNSSSDSSVRNKSIAPRSQSKSRSKLNATSAIFTVPDPLYEDARATDAVKTPKVMKTKKRSIKGDNDGNMDKTKRQSVRKASTDSGGTIESAKITGTTSVSGVLMGGKAMPKPMQLPTKTARGTSKALVTNSVSNSEPLLDSIRPRKKKKKSKEVTQVTG
ncbi:hypothetical protein EV361DRAFT_440396 [Lentinula raphanica]|uniref:Uncharacterized protein n=1 Tax=Lentinula raphanica TaxID=153919 RepID=A0AA38P230_9AGAR|nr:hypothetical protein F5878DRAFT_343656 [Lentinula raphanica]KAJ3968116.1 hypothetical protein EV361DRAFT_440396 [Lentinula raphanica]